MGSPLFDALGQIKTLIDRVAPRLIVCLSEHAAGAAEALAQLAAPGCYTLGVGSAGDVPARGARIAEEDGHSRWGLILGDPVVVGLDWDGPPVDLLVIENSLGDIAHHGLEAWIPLLSARGAVALCGVNHPAASGFTDAIRSYFESDFDFGRPFLRNVECWEWSYEPGCQGVLFAVHGTREAKVVITGPGHCGKTFLVQLLTLLGLDTGFICHDGVLKHASYERPVVDEHGMAVTIDRQPPPGWTEPWGNVAYDQVVDAGFDKLIAADMTEHQVAQMCRVIEDPRLIRSLGNLLDKGLIRIEHVVCALRNVKDTVRSKDRFRGRSRHVHEGDADQVCRDVHDFALLLAEREIPHTLLAFPRFVQDPAYCRRKLLPLLHGVSVADFFAAFGRLAEVTQVHFR